MPPELVMECKLSPAVDVYSFGVRGRLFALCCRLGCCGLGCAGAAARAGGRGRAVPGARRLAHGTHPGAAPLALPLLRRCFCGRWWRGSGRTAACRASKFWAPSPAAAPWRCPRAGTRRSRWAGLGVLHRILRRSLRSGGERACKRSAAARWRAVSVAGMECCRSRTVPPPCPAGPHRPLHRPRLAAAPRRHDCAGRGGANATGV